MKRIASCGAMVVVTLVAVFGAGYAPVASADEGDWYATFEYDGKTYAFSHAYSETYWSTAVGLDFANAVNSAPNGNVGDKGQAWCNDVLITEGPDDQHDDWFLPNFDELLTGRSGYQGGDPLDVEAPPLCHGYDSLPLRALWTATTCSAGSTDAERAYFLYPLNTQVIDDDALGYMACENEGAESHWCCFDKQDYGPVQVCPLVRCVRVISGPATETLIDTSTSLQKDTSMVSDASKDTPVAIEAAGTYYVAPDGNDSNPGTEAQPWRTIQKAASTVSAGDTVYVRGGVYQETVSFGRSGTATQPIRVLAYPGETPVVDGDNYRLPTTDWGTLFSVSGDYVEVSGFEIRYSNWMGFVISGGHSRGSSLNVHHTQEQGALVVGDYGVIENSHVWQCALRSYSGAGWACALCAARGARNAALRGNVSHNNAGEGLSTFEAFGTVMEGNTVYDNMTNIYVSDSQNVLVQRNLVYRTGNTESGSNNGIMLGDEKHNPPSQDITIVNNLVTGCNRNVYWWQGPAGEGMLNVLIANNTLVNSSGGANLQINAGPHQNVRIHNNIVLQETSSPIVGLDTLTGLTLSHNLWSRTPQSGASGPGDVIGDPQLVDVSKRNFHLRETSPAIDAGIDVGLAIDFDGNPRPQGKGYDIGAYETAAGPGPTATTTGTPTSTPTQAPTPTATPTQTATPTSTPMAVATPTDTPTRAPTPTDTPTQAPTATDTPTQAPTATDTPTQAPTATDTPTQASTATPTPIQASTALNVGQNLVSVPISPVSTVITRVLSSVDGSYDLVYAYVRDSGGGTWKEYDVTRPPFLNSLTDIDRSMGFWIRMTEAVSWSVEGTEPETTAIELLRGWNLVGYPSDVTRPITEALQSIDGRYDLVYAYHAEESTEAWKTYDVARPPFLNTLTHMDPWRGYWIRATEDCTLTIAYE